MTVETRSCSNAVHDPDDTLAGGPHLEANVTVSAVDLVAARPLPEVPKHHALSRGMYMFSTNPIGTILHETGSAAAAGFGWKLPSVSSLKSTSALIRR